MTTLTYGDRVRVKPEHDKWGIAGRPGEVTVIGHKWVWVVFRKCKAVRFPKDEADEMLVRL